MEAPDSTPAQDLVSVGAVEGSGGSANGSEESPAGPVGLEENGGSANGFEGSPASLEAGGVEPVVAEAATAAAETLGAERVSGNVQASGTDQASGAEHGSGNEQVSGNAPPVTDASGAGGINGMSGGINGSHRVRAAMERMGEEFVCPVTQVRRVGSGYRFVGMHGRGKHFPLP